MTNFESNKKKRRPSGFASPNAHMFREQPGDDYPTAIGSVLRQQLSEGRSLETDPDESANAKTPNKPAPPMDWKQHSKIKKQS